MKKLTFLAVLFLMTALSAQAQLVTTYDLVMEESPRDIGPMEKISSFYSPNDRGGIWVSVFEEKSDPKFSRGGKIMGSLSFSCRVNGQTINWDKVPMPNEGGKTKFESQKKIGNRTYVFVVDISSKKGLLAFFDDPIPINPMDEYNQKKAAKGF